MKNLTCTSPILLKLVILLCIIQVSYAANYLVGGELGWGLTSNVERWSEENIFVEGDTIVFVYEPIHSVLEVNEAAYNSCALDNPVSVATGTLTSVKFEIPGKRYFICGTKNHCISGLKVKLIVNPMGTPVAAPPSEDDDDFIPLPPPTPPSKSHHYSAASKVSFSMCFVTVVQFICLCYFLIAYYW